MGVERCAVTLATEDGNQLEIKGLFSKKQADGHKLIGTKFLWGDIPAMTKAIKKGKPFVINDISDVPSKSKTREYFRKVGIKSVLGVGMFFGKKLVGILSITSIKEQKTFSQEETKLLQTMANQIAIAIENARLLEVIKKHTQDLRDLSAELMKVQENERKRIAQELHDEVGQMLQSMKMNLDRVKRNLSSKPQKLEGIDDWLLDTEKLLRQTIEDIRTLTFDLRPSMLDDFGLIPTLGWYIENYSRRSNIKVFLKAKDPKYRFPAEVEITLYRIIQEALTNVSKHAQATAASVLVSPRNGTVILSVRDNGAGFDTSKVLSAPRGMGLLNIKERVNLLGGSFEINSRSRKGTRINITIPFSEVKHEEGQIIGG
jgi:signal transduction histidine kinase